MTEQNLSNIKLHVEDSVDYHKSSECTTNDLFLETLELNTLDMNENYYVKDKYYSNLENRCVDIGSFNSSTDKVKIKFVCDGLISRLNLVDFPITQYTLSLNGHNATTAIISKEDGITFDITKSLQNESSYMSKLSSLAFGVEPKIENRKDYINLGRVDNATINVPKNIKFEKNTVLHIEAFGYFIENGVWSELKSKIIDIYPNCGNNFELCLNHPTDSIDIEVKGLGSLILLINGLEYKKIEINSSNINFPFHRIKFTDPNEFYKGQQNNHLSTKINKNTINLSRVDNVRLIILGCTVTSITQHVYITYSYPERHKLYSN